MMRQMERRSTDLCECPATATEQSVFIRHFEFLLVNVSGRFQVIVESLA
jgi:hypothetical protein